MEITTRIIKGGALLAESCRFVDEWDISRGLEENFVRCNTGNVLGKRSRSRAEDTLAILRQRFIKPGPDVIRALKVIRARADGFRDACYYEAARNDELIGHTAGDVLYRSRSSGWAKITVEDVAQALLDAPPSAAVKEWSEGTRRRVVQGLLSALRDFEVLDGAVIKHLAPSHLSFAGFVYVLGRLRTRVASSHEIVTNGAWRWWLLDYRQVRGLFLEADREGLLQYSEAGTTVRIDWRTAGLEEMVRAIA